MLEVIFFGPDMCEKKYLLVTHLAQVVPLLQPHPIE